MFAPPEVMADNGTEDLCQLTSCEPTETNMSCGGVENNANLRSFEAYNIYHGYISSAVCVFGVILNVINIVVLTRPSMRTPTNFLLTTVAVADLVKMATYAVYSIYLNVFSGPTPCQPHARPWMVYILLHTCVLIAMHTISTLIMVCLAVTRCISVYMPLRGPKLCTMRHVRLATVVVAVISALSASSNLFMYRICRVPGIAEGWWFEIRGWAFSLEMINFIVYGMVVKILASVLISVLSAMLILAMRKASQRRSRLRGQQQKGPRKSSRADVGTQEARESQRNTAMLATVVISFVVTEFPQGVVNMTAALSICFHLHVYAKIGDFMDTLVLLNSSINFILYCAMSQQFRETFCQLFCRCARQSSPQREGYRLTATKTITGKPADVHR